MTTLTDEEKASALWKKIMAHFEERLATLRLSNDKDQTEAMTASIRGSIKEIKLLQKLNNEKPIIE